MPADAAGNNVAAAFVPVTGFFGYAPSGTTIPTASGGAAVPLTLDSGFKKAGLLTEDGGFDWDLEADGDALVFWQDGYSIPSGLATATLTVKLAQYDEVVRSLIWGKTADANGYITIEASGTTKRYALFTEEIAKNGTIRRRVAADSAITSVKVDKNERGSVNGVEVVFTVARSALLNNEHLGEWLIGTAASAVATLSTALPSAAVAGSLVTITGSNFTGATGVKFGAVNSALFFIDSDTQIRAVMPPGSAGTANITVINSFGTSTALAYTRGA